MKMTLTKKDIENLKAIFATKQELFSFQSDMEKFRNDVLTGQDKLIKMFEIRQLEDLNAMDSERSRDRMLQDHEKRIQTLETTGRPGQSR